MYGSTIGKIVASTAHNSVLRFAKCESTPITSPQMQNVLNVVSNECCLSYGVEWLATCHNLPTCKAIKCFHMRLSLRVTARNVSETTIQFSEIIRVRNNHTAL